MNLLNHCVFLILSLTQPTTTYGTSFPLTHKSLLSYSVTNRKKIPIDIDCNEDNNTRLRRKMVN